jgi:signal transduction histidine kinase
VPSLLARRSLDAFVVALAVLAQVEVARDPALTPRLVTAPAALLWTLPLLLRRRFGLGAPAVVFAVLAAESFLPGQVVTSSQTNALALLVAFWAVGCHANPRRALGGGAIGYVALAVIVLNESPGSADTLGLLVAGAAAWALGRTLAERDRRAVELEQRAERLEREHERALLADRARLAGELHDVIAHSVSVMTVQAGAARLLLDQDPVRAREPLVAVEESGRQALGELRRLLGILHGAGDDAGLAPQPGVAQLPTLVEHVRSAGVPVAVTTEGEPRPLAPGVDLTAYRVVQEALTNVLKHAGAARAQVHLRYDPTALAVEVVDSGRTAAGGEAGGVGDEGGGHGLAGMRRRVALYHGELEAGPGPGGGYRVRARLPLDPAGP